MEAAVRAGADAVYFGLQSFNARARAENFNEKDLPETLRFLHERGVKGACRAKHPRIRPRA